MRNIIHRKRAELRRSFESNLQPHDVFFAVNRPPLQSLTSFYGLPARAHHHFLLAASAAPRDQTRQKQAPILAPNLCQMQSIIALQWKPIQLLPIENSMRLFCSITSPPLRHHLSFIHRKIHRYSAHHLVDVQHRINRQETRLQSAQTRFRQPQILIK